MTAPYWKSAPPGSVWMWMGSRWGRARSMNSSCDSIKAPSFCNCLSSFHRATCGKCKIGYTLQGYHHNTSKWANKSSDGDKEFTGYHCVRNNQVNVPNCKIFSPEDDYGGYGTCVQCDYDNGFRMTNDYMCIEQELNVM